MKSKIKINKRMNKKTNSKLAKAIFLAKKNNLLEIADALAIPTRKQSAVSIERLNKEVGEGEGVLVPGKIVGQGSIKKKIKVYALGFSEQAKEKLKKAGCEFKEVGEILGKEKKLKVRVLK